MNRKRDIQEQDREKEEQALSLMFLVLLFAQIVKAQSIRILFARNADFTMAGKS